jgi:hypothetical protein
MPDIMSQAKAVPITNNALLNADKIMENNLRTCLRNIMTSRLISVNSKIRSV